MQMTEDFIVIQDTPCRIVDNTIVANELCVTATKTHDRLFYRAIIIILPKTDRYVAPSFDK